MTLATWVQIASDRGRRSAYTLIELLTTIAALIIVLGLMISLAGHVREQSAELLTKEVLIKLDAVMKQYYEQHGHELPAVVPLITGSTPPEETAIQRAVRDNNRSFVRALRQFQDLSGGVFSKLPVSLYDEVNIRDGWGNLIAFMPSGRRDIGTASQDRFFFFSPGPDRRYLTRQDNIYSYEMTATPGG
jgi:type II secretory pathway pseudopilin PulG